MDLSRLEFGVAWEPHWSAFWTSLAALLKGPRAPKEEPLQGGLALRVYWIRGQVPARALAASSLWHCAIVLVALLPIWSFLPGPRHDLAPVRIELTWYGAAQDLPEISLPGRAAKPIPLRSRRKPFRRGANAYHPRQTIVSVPVRVTHPRQTLIQPEAPAAPPKVLPSLPNMVEWAATMSWPKPALRISPVASAPKVRRRVARDATVPQIANEEKNVGPLNIASGQPLNLQPRLPVNPMSAPLARRQSPAIEAVAPEIAAASSPGDASLHRLIALSSIPAPPAQAVAVPSGNLAARFAISPERPQPSTPEGGERAARGSGEAFDSAVGASPAAAGETSALPAGIRVSGGTKTSESGGGLAIHSAPHLNLRPLRTAPRNLDANTLMRTGSAATTGKIDSSLPPEKILADRQVYTLYVNMPNLASATGSWILNFAQLDEDDLPRAIPRGELSGPVPVHKVDPKYPPALVEAHVQGVVVLYAIIRKDGSVDSIQLVRGLDPQLDSNSIQALAGWKFRPATRQGVPINLEAVVRIPFRYAAPQY